MFDPWHFWFCHSPSFANRTQSHSVGSLTHDHLPSGNQLWECWALSWHFRVLLTRLSGSLIVFQAFLSPWYFKVVLTQLLSLLYICFLDWHCPSATCWSCWGPRNRQGCWQRDPCWCSDASGSRRTRWACPRGWWTIPTGEELGKRTSLWRVEDRGVTKLLKACQLTCLRLSGCQFRIGLYMWSQDQV